MSSVIVKFTDPDAIRDAVAEFAGSLRRSHPEIHRIIWFGSWVKGTYTPGSDVDLCIVVSETTIPVRDRASNYMPWRFPVGMDLFVYTEEEFDELPRQHPQWYAEISSGELQ